MLYKYSDAAMFKNTVLKYMPRITIDEVECLASLIYYDWKRVWYVDDKTYDKVTADKVIAEQALTDYHNNVISKVEYDAAIKDNLYYKYRSPILYKTETHTKLYKVFGIDIQGVMIQDHGQLEEAWIGFYAPKDDVIVLTDAQIIDYIKEFSPMIYPTHTDVFNPVNNPCPMPLTDPITPCVFTNLNPDIYKIDTYETRIVTEAYTDAFQNFHPLGFNGVVNWNINIYSTKFSCN